MSNQPPCVHVEGDRFAFTFRHAMVTAKRNGPPWWAWALAIVHGGLYLVSLRTGGFFVLEVLIGGTLTCFIGAAVALAPRGTRFVLDRADGTYWIEDTQHMGGRVRTGKLADVEAVRAGRWTIELVLGKDRHEKLLLEPAYPYGWGTTPEREQTEAYAVLADAIRDFLGLCHDGAQAPDAAGQAVAKR